MEKETTRRVRVLPSPVLKEEIHGAEGTLVLEKKVNPPSGPAYSMYHVKLDKCVATNGVDGYIVHGEICFPEECFEEILC